MSTMYASQFNFMQPIENLQKTTNNSKEFIKEKENLSKSALLMRQRSKPNGTRAVSKYTKILILGHLTLTL